MKIIFVLAFLLAFIASVTVPQIKLGEKISFDSSNKEFALTDKAPNKNILLVLISHEEGKKLGYKFASYYDTTYYKGILDKEIGIIWDYSHGPCEFALNLIESDKGSLMIYDLQTTLKTKLRNKYGYKYMFLKSYIYENNFNESLTKISFSVPEFRTNANIYFEFNERILNYTIFSNPFEVCHKDICTKNIKKYFFE